LGKYRMGYEQKKINEADFSQSNAVKRYKIINLNTLRE
jgi:hypothetical protein